MAFLLVSHIKTYFSRKDSFAANTLTLMTGTILSQSIAIAFTPILTRLYSPNDLGTLEIYGSILTILVVIASGRYHVAIPLPQDDETAACLFTLSFILVIGMTITTGILIFFFNSKILFFFKAQIIEPYIIILPFGLLIAGFYQIFNFWAIRKKSFGLIARTKVTQVFGRILIQLGFGLWRGGPLGLLLGDVCGHGSGSSRIAISMWRFDRQSFKKVSWAGIRKVLHRYKQFPFLSSPAALLNMIGFKLPSLLLAIYYGLNVVGWFALATWVLSAPMLLITNSLSQVYMAEIARMVRQTPERLYAFFWKNIQILTIIAIPIASAMALLAPSLFPILFGSGWHEAGVYVRLLSVMFVLQVISCLGSTLDVLERQDLFMIREIIRTVLTGGAVIWSGTMHYSPKTAVLLLAFAGSASHFLGMVFVWQAIKKFSQK